MRGATSLDSDLAAWNGVWNAEFGDPANDLK